MATFQKAKKIFGNLFSQLQFFEVENVDHVLQHY